MNSKHSKVLSVLNSADDFISSTFIANKLSISSRTVKTYINDIQFEYPELIWTSNKGYLLNKSLYKQISGIDRDIPQNQEERIRYIINFLLSLNEGESVDIDELSETIFVSNATIRRDLQIVGELCYRYNIKVSIANDFVSLSGKEKNKRALINYIYQNEMEQNEFNLDTIQKLFPDYNLSTIKSVTIDKCKQFIYLINGYTIDQIVLDIIIQIDRIKNSFRSDQTVETVQFNVHELELARAITNEFEKIFGINYSPEEIQAFTIILFTHLLKIDYQKITIEDLIHIVGQDVFNLANEIIEDTNDYFLKNQNEEFFVRFTLHLKNLLIRAKSNYINQNLLTDTIKNSCPLLFECAVNISNNIFKKTGYQINEDEIAYIAIHIGSLLEINSSFKLSCGLVIPKYYNIANELKEKIESRVSQDATITFINEDDFNEHNSLDLIITTNPHLNVSKEKCVVFSGILNDKELKKIEDKVGETKNRKNKELIINQLITITSSKFFYYNPKERNHEALIKMMSNDLLDSGLVNYDYLDDVMYRERISSTAFNQIAVPHTLSMSANQTMISIAIFDKPITWNDKKVSVVFMFAIHPNDRKMFHFIFDNLVSLLIDEDNIAILKKCSSYKQFLEAIPNIKS